MAKKKAKTKKANQAPQVNAKKKARKAKSAPAQYPRHAVDKALRIPGAILEQNAGKSCTVKQSASFLGVGAAGPYTVEVSSGIKYGFLERPVAGQIAVTDRAKKVLRPQDQQDEVQGLRDAVLNAPVVSEVYSHYRGENLPDAKFFRNALIDTFAVPAEKVDEFRDIFVSSLQAAKLLTEHDGKYRVVDVSHDAAENRVPSPTLKKLEQAVKVDATDSCFVMMPFAPPHGEYYAKIYKPAIDKVGLRPVRADTEIFGTGKIMDQIWSGINAAKVLVAELTTRNPNVFYELGLAHALEKPVVLVSSNEKDVPFDLRHIRVIYYDVDDPFWGSKLLDKVTENILSAIENPKEAVLKSQPDT